MKDRGLVREGAWADLVVFDPAKVQDRSDFNDPHHYATGIPFVLVNGVPGADLNDSAMRAAKSWTYRPATKGGVPVRTWKVEQVAFKM